MGNKNKAVKLPCYKKPMDKDNHLHMEDTGYGGYSGYCGIRGYGYNYILKY